MPKIRKSQIAIGNYHYGLYSFEFFLDSVKKTGIKNIELWGAKPHFCVDDQDKVSVSELTKKIKDRDLNLVCFCPEQNTYPINITCKDDKIRKRSIEHLKRAIEVCSWLDVPRMLLCPGNGYIDEAETEMWERCRFSLMELVKTASKYGVCLMLETQSQHESLFMNTVVQQKKMIDEVSHQNLKAMLDTVQLAKFDKDVEGDIKILGMEDIKHVHLGNTLMQEKTWYDKNLPENLCRGKKTIGHIGFREGNLPLELYLNQLGEAGYDSYLTIEICQNQCFMDAHKYAQEAVEYVYGLLR